MKRLFLTVSFLFALFIASNAQSEHLKFKGIPIDGDYRVFAKALMAKGFKQVGVDEDWILLTGNFMATPNVGVLVYPDPSSKVVTGVSAMILAGDNWPDIEAKFDGIVNSYTIKYGEPTKSVREFTENAPDDWWRLHRLREGQCNYRYCWDMDGNRIDISLSYINGACVVNCVYIDGQNASSLFETVYDDI